MLSGVPIALTDGMQSTISENSKEYKPQLLALENCWLVNNQPAHEKLSTGPAPRTPAVRPAGLRLLAVVLLILACLGCRAFAVSVELTWDQSSDPDVVGYNIYYGTTSGVYTNEVAFGNVNNAVITNLTPGVTYYFNATDRDAVGDESAFSGETSYTAPYPVTLAMSVSSSRSSVNFTASGQVPASWRIEMSTDLINWVPFYYGVGSPVNVSIPVANVPKQFFRLAKN